ncbi:MAG TPA: hypothetical protein VGC30_03655 [Dokdonella sp.]
MTGNRAFSGGGVSVIGGNLYLDADDVAIDGNTADLQAGGVYLVRGELVSGNPDFAAARFDVRGASIRRRISRRAANAPTCFASARRSPRRRRGIAGAAWPSARRLRTRPPVPKTTKPRMPRLRRIARTPDALLQLLGDRLAEVGR